MTEFPPSGLRPSRRAVLAGLAAAGATAPLLARAAWAEGGAATKVDRITVSARPIDGFARASSRTTFGKLEYRGGLVLTSSHPAFGGWSGLTIEEDGKRFLAIGDEGTWMTGTLTYDGKRPNGMDQVMIGPIQGLKGRTLDKKRDLDAEGVALYSGTLSNGVALVSFERNHRIGRFTIGPQGLSAPQGYLKAPPDWKRIKDSNKSLEAVTVVRGGPLKGSVVAFAEAPIDKPNLFTGWIWAGLDAEPRAFNVTQIGDFEVTDAVTLWDGTLLISERSFKWTEGVKLRLRRFKPSEVQPGAKLDGEVLIEADMGYEIDNMECLAAHRAPDGTTVLTLISDDNFNQVLQRTELLQFTLTDAPKAA